MTSNDAKQGNLVVYRGWPEQGVYVVSPFVIKLEARLRFSGLPYETKAGSSFWAPKGKIPYVQIGDDASSQMGDSTLIIQHLIEEYQLDDLNARLSPSSKAIDLAFRALSEDKLYFYNMRERWQDNYYTQRDIALHAVPYPIRILLGLLISRGIGKTLHGQGTGRLSPDEVRKFRREIYEAFSSQLVDVNGPKAREGRKPFWLLGGERPSEADATLYGFIVTALVSPAGPESTKLVLRFPILMDYAGRIHEQYFADYPKWTE